MKNVNSELNKPWKYEIGCCLKNFKFIGLKNLLKVPLIMFSVIIKFLMRSTNKKFITSLSKFLTKLKLSFPSEWFLSSYLLSSPSKLKAWQIYFYSSVFAKETYYSYPANIYLFKWNNRITRKRCEICLKQTIKTSECWKIWWYPFLLWTFSFDAPAFWFRYSNFTDEKNSFPGKKFCFLFLFNWGLCVVYDSAA